MDSTNTSIEILKQEGDSALDLLSRIETLEEERNGLVKERNKRLQGELTVISAKKRVDEELTRMKSIQEFVGNALLIREPKALTEFFLETIVEAFECENVFLLSVDHLKGNLSVEDMKIFENYMIENSEFSKKVKNISKIVSTINMIPKIETSNDFLHKLDSKINKKSILGFQFSPVFINRISYSFAILMILFFITYESKNEKEIMAYDEINSNSLNTIESDTLKNDNFIIKQVVGKKKTK